MANNNVQNVSNAKGVAGGYVYVAPKGTTLPTDYSTSLSGSFKNLGFVSSNGIEPNEDMTITRFYDMNGDIVSTAMSERVETFKLTFIEVKEDVLSTLYGSANVSASSSVITAKHKGTGMLEYVFVFELVLRDGRRWRRVLPAGQITGRKESNLVSSELFGYETEITANQGSDGSTVIDYIQASSSTTTTVGA